MPSRLLRCLLVAVIAIGAVFVVTPGAEASSSEDGRLISVIVRAEPGAVDNAKAAVEAAGGSVGRSLDILDGFAAEVPASAVDGLMATEDVLSVSSNERVKLSSGTEEGFQVDWEDGGALASIAQVAAATGAHEAWFSGITGKGVGVALIDSGVVPVTGLQGNVVDGPDLSFESQAEDLRHLDTFGHGTHMAGIIAANDWWTDQTDTDGFVGVAPGSKLINLKVASYDGATDVSQVIAAIDWVVKHRNDPGLNIRVLNLSFGTDGTQNYRIDPLAFAVEQAWKKGIVVVVSAGNKGNDTKTLDNPAYDPYVIAVGATDTGKTPETADDKAADFSNGGNSSRRPDLSAPGRSLVSLRSEGSLIDAEHPEGRVGDRYFRGSGTSQAAAVVSGVAALVLQHRPTLSPDQVKDLLVRTATPLAGANPLVTGAGQVHAGRAMRARPNRNTTIQRWTPSTGLGSLDASRGSSTLVAEDVELRGEIDIFGNTWDGVRWSSASATETSWDGGLWNGTRWSGDSWAGTRWSSVLWSGTRWSGTRWSADDWSGTRWSGTRWSGTRWSGTRWSGTRWSSVSGPVAQ